MNASDLRVGTMVVEPHRVGRTLAWAFYRYTVGAVHHGQRDTHYQLAETEEFRVCPSDVDVLTDLPERAIDVAYLPAAGAPEVLTILPDRHIFQALVGGPIQALALSEAYLYFRAGGPNFDLPYNHPATRLTQKDACYRRIGGDAVAYGPHTDYGVETSIPVGYRAQLGLTWAGPAIGVMVCAVCAHPLTHAFSTFGWIHVTPADHAPLPVDPHQVPQLPRCDICYDEPTAAHLPVTPFGGPGDVGDVSCICGPCRALVDHGQWTRLTRRTVRVMAANLTWMNAGYIESCVNRAAVAAYVTALLTQVRANITGPTEPF